MSNFAKVFDTDIGQLLIKIDTSDEGSGYIPEVRFYFQPEGLGVCSFALLFSDDQEGWDKADTCFQKLDKESCYELVKGQLDELDITEESL